MKKFLFTVSTVVLFATSGISFADAKPGVKVEATPVIAPVAGSNMKIGVLDTSKIAMNTPQFKAAQDKFKNEIDALEKEKLNAQKSLQSDIEAFQKNSPTMKADAKQAAQQKIIDQQKKMQEKLGKRQDEISASQNKEMQALSKKVEGVVNAVAAEEKLDLVIIKAATAFSKPEIDITDKVIKKMKG